MDVPPPIPNLNAAILAAAEILEDHINAPIAPAFSDESDDDNSDSGDEDLPIMLHTEEEEHVRNKHYVVNVVYYMSDLDFRRHFRLSRSGVEELYMELKEDEIHSEGRPSIPFEHVLLLSLWLLATPESFRSVADRFGIDRGHAHVLCLSIYQKMYDRRNTWIRWPRGEEAVRCVQDFEERGFPGVFGAVDGCYIAIPGPLRDDSYFNRKSFHAITLQGVCDSHMRFIDVFCGFPSSANDARVWANSPLGLALDQNSAAHLPPDCHLLGDKAYPCRTYLIPPFKDNGHLTQQMIQFNTKLSSVRVLIENTFGRLKGIFRRMKYLHVTNLNYAKYYIVAACILHNIVIKERFHLGDLEFDVDVDDDDDSSDEDFDEDLDNDVNVAPNPNQNETGPEKRIRLMQLVVPL